MLDETYSFCKKRFQRYIQNGIDNRMFENWLSKEDDLIPIMNMAIHMLRPQHEHIIRNTYIRIIDSYRLRLEVEYQQTGYCPEQSIYNTDVDIDEAFNNVDKRDVQLYAKDFRGYVRHGIWGDSFPSWVSEDDLIPIVYMAINDEVHNITKRAFIVNDGNDTQVDEYYCLGVEGEKVELSSDLLDLAEQVTGRIANDEGNDDISEYCMSAWSISADEGWRSYAVTDTKYWKYEHRPNTLQKSKAGNGWWTFYEVHKSNGGAWRYICHPDITKLHLKLTLSSSLVGLNHAFPNLTALVIDYTEHPDGAGQYGDHFCSFRGEPVLNYNELQKYSSSLTHLEIWLDKDISEDQKVDPRSQLYFLNLSIYQINYGKPTSVERFSQEEYEDLYPLYLYYG